MARGCAFDTAAKRSRLPAQKNPYWQGISGGRGGVSLGYRKPKHGAGSWVVKLALDRRRIEERLSQADDVEAAADALPYPAAVTAALDWARLRLRSLEAAEKGAPEEHPTVGSAMEAYATVHAARIEKPTSYMSGTFKRHVLSNEAFAATRLDRLTSAKILAWRKTLPVDISTRSHNWIVTQVRAALNYAAGVHRQILPAATLAEIQHGMRAQPGGDKARKQVFATADIRRVVDKAFEVDETGDFGRLALVLAATGARFSQVARITVGNVQPERSRIMVPSARKGRRPKEARLIAVPVGEDVIQRLRCVLDGRRADEPLLLRWHHQKVRGHLAWQPVERRPWPTARTARADWIKACKSAGMSNDTVMLCFRHSSIVRGLSAGLPIRLVAALHDTSVEMIEDHYSAYIVDATEELARRAVTPLTSASVATLRPAAVEAVA